MAGVRLDHLQIAIPAGGEDRARRFWSGLLGLEEIAKPPALAARGGLWFNLGGVQLHLGVDPDFRPAAKAHAGLVVEDFDGAMAALTAAGIEVEPGCDARGRRRAYLADPFGNRLELIAESVDRGGPG